MVSAAGCIHKLKTNVSVNLDFFVKSSSVAGLGSARDSVTVLQF